MPYSEAVKRNGSLRDFTSIGAPRSSASAGVSPQHGRNHNHGSRKLRTAGGCARSREDEEDDAGADADESEADSEAGDSFVSGRNLSRAMGASARRHIKSKSSRGSKREIREEIVVSQHKPSSSKSKRAVERGDIPSDGDYAGPSNAVPRTNASSKSGSIQKTYPGPRKIKNASASSASNHNILRAPGYNGFRPSRLALHSEENDTSDGDVFEEPLPLEEPSRVDLRKEVTRCGPPNRSARSGAINRPPSHSSKPSLQSRSHNKFSSNPFYASLTDVINGQRHQTLRNQTLLERKPKSRPKPKTPSTPPQSQMLVRTQRAAPPRSSFACVLISPRPLPVPREQYKSFDEYDAEEETERRSRDEARKPKKKQKGRDIINEKACKRRGPIEKPSKQRQNLQEAIYVSSGSEVPVAGPSRAVASRRLHNLVEDSDVEMADNAPIVIDATSEDQYEPSGRSPRNGSSTKTISAPSPPVKRQRKKRRTEVIISSESASESNILPAQEANSREGQRSLSPDLLATPQRIAPERASESRVEDATEEVVEPNVEDVAEAPAMNDQANAVVEPSPPEEHSHAAPSERQKEVPSPTSALPEVVASSKPPSNNHHQSAQPRSPTLCLTGTLSQLTPLSPSSRSTTLAVPEERHPSDASGDSDSDIDLKMTKIGGDAKCVEDLKNDTREESDHQVEKQVSSSSSSDEEDDVCHRCRNRNVYAKMKCTKLKKNGVCQLYFCHRCCAVYLPKIEFDPYSATFVCPACDGTCDCINCCKKRGEQPVPAQRGLRWDHLGVELLLSHQETRRRERREMRRRAGKLSDTEAGNKSSKARKRFHVEAESTVERTPDMGEEAKAWIERQRAGRRRVRAFVGAWQEAWGPTPFTVHEMDNIDLDVHAVNGTGKGKGRAVDPNLRLFVGDEEGLCRPFVRADDVVISGSSSPKKRPGRKRKQAITDSIYVTPTEVPDSKKRRLTNPITIPEFTLNHQDKTASSSAASSAYHPTPDNFTYLGLEPGPLNTDPYAHLRYPGVINDPVLGVINDPLGSDGIDADMYAPDWDSVATKPSGSGGFTEPDFAYEGSYDSYAAALGNVDGLEQYDPTFSYNLGDAVCRSPGRSSKDDGQAAHSTAILKPKDTNSNADIDITDLIDPALIEQSDPKAREQNSATDLDPDPDPMQFLTAHGRETALLPVPMIYGVPSSTGLSLQDLERTVHDSLSALRVGSESSA